MPAALTADLLSRYYQRKSEKSELERRARGMNDELSDLEKQITDALSESGKRSAKRGELVATLVEKQKTVAWKAEFIRECGHDKATELKACAGVRDALQVAPA